MGRKRNPVLPIFTRDILSSPRCRALSEAAAGVYFFLLCRMNEPPQPGAYRLSDWDPHPTWQRSKTQQCLATANKYERLQYFAALLAKNDLPWKQKGILAGLQELYRYGIIVVEGDMLVQPRMYKDNGFTLPDIDGDGDPEGTILDDPASGSMASKDGSELSENKGAKSGTQKRTKKGTEKVQRKVRVSPAPASRKEVEVENNINSIDKGNIGGVGEKEPDTTSTTSTTSPAPSASSSPAASDKTHKNAPTTSETAQISTNGGEVGQLSTEQEKPRQKPLKSKSAPTDQSQTKQKTEVADNPPTLADVQAYADERAQQGKPFLYVTPEEFFNTCEMDGWKRKGKPLFNWKAYMLRFEQYRKDHGELTIEQRSHTQQGAQPPTAPPKPGDPVNATRPTKNKYKNKW